MQAVTSARAAATLDADVAVVGAGPTGIVTALELARGGLDVLLIESGERRRVPEIQSLGDAAAIEPPGHAPMVRGTRRQLGGASNLWGGRCVPYRLIDFEDRQFIPDGSWPITLAELVPFYARASAWLSCGSPEFDASHIDGLARRALVPGFPEGDVRASTLERWSNAANFRRRYAEELDVSGQLRLLAGHTCTGILRERDGSAVRELELKPSSSAAAATAAVRARAYVVACGGLDTARLLLASKRDGAEAPGNQGGHLGRWYQGHVDGKIAAVRFTTTPEETLHGYELTPDGVFARRRLTFSGDFQLQHELPNISAWLVNPELADPRHGNGILSGAYLLLNSPLGPYLASDQLRSSLTRRTSGGARRLHLRNVVSDLPATARFAAETVMKRAFRRPRPPGYYAFSHENKYPLQYHAEHLPNPQSRVLLSDERDRLGMPRIRISMRFSQRDVETAIRAHRYWDEYLREAKLGRLEYFSDDLQASVRSQLGGGRHQIGTARMSKRPEDGVVDGNLRVHDVENLFVAGSSVFATSSEATPTFLAVVLAVRLADHLKAELT